MPTKTPTVFRALLRDAFTRTWEHKRLWAFGVFAALVSTGGVADVAFRSLRRIEQSRDIALDALAGSIPGLPTVSVYMRGFGLLPTDRVALTLGLFGLMGILLVVVAILSQGAMLRGIIDERSTTLADAKHVFLRLLGLAVTTRLVRFALLLSTALMLVLFLHRGDVMDGVLFVGIFLVLFPASVVVSLISLLAAVDLVKRDTTIPSALEAATRLFARHWLAALELGAVLFLVIACAGIVTAAGLVLLSLPYALLSGAALATGSPFLFAMTATTFALLAAAGIACAIGGVTTFQHAVWVAFYEKAGGGAKRGKILAKLERLWQNW